MSEEYERVKKEAREFVQLSRRIEMANRELKEKEAQLDILRKEVYEKVEDHIRDVAERVGSVLPRLVDNIDDGVTEECKEYSKEVREVIKNASYSSIVGSRWDLTDQRVKQTIFSMALHYTDTLVNLLVKNPYKNGLEKSMERFAKAVATVEKYFPEGVYFNIPQEYIEAKKNEIISIYELEAHKARQAEERRAILQAQREELAAQREIEREIKRAQKDEQEAQAKLEHRRMELAQAKSVAEISRLKDYIERLQLAVKEAQQRHERALSMAQQTRAGYVYVISNIGSFGEGVYKIGMTRRIEPIERVLELGDASVPFPFDVHAMIWSEDAPTLEAELHRAFDDRKVNAINGRKEFFRVTLDEVRTVLDRMGVDAVIVDYPTAAQYRDSLMMSR